MAENLSVNRAMINKLVDIVNANIHDENFGVKKLAEEAGMSRVTVHRKIKSINNQTVSQFIREIRLQKAIEMLKNDEGNVAEIAYKVGFGSPSYFIKCFHELFGFSPGEARKMINNELWDDLDVEKSTKKNDYKEFSLNPEIKSILRKNKQKNILIASFGILLVLLVIYLILTPREPQEKSIAVLPFRNDNPDTTNIGLINGIMERITTNLSLIKELRVISRNSVEKYRYNKIKSASEIARELGVNYIVEGSVRKYGNSYSISIHLIMAKGKEISIWEKTYDQEIKDVYDHMRLESEIAREIAGELEAIVSPYEKQLIDRIPTTNLTALDFCLKGKEAYSEYFINGDISDLEAAEGYFNIALEYDSAYAQAYAGLARIYQITEYYDTYYSDDFLDTVLLLSNKALSFNDNIEEAYIARGDYYNANGLKDKAIDDYKKAIKINPNSWEVYYKIPTDDLVTRIENLHKAASLNRGNELPEILNQLAYYLGRLGGFSEQARIYLQQALELDGDSASYYFNLAGMERSQGNYTEDIDYLLKSYSFDSSNTFTIERLGETYGYIGQYKESLKYMKIFLDKQQNPLVAGIRHGAQRIGYAYWQNGYITEGEYYFKVQIESCLSEDNLERRSGMDDLFNNYDLAGIYAFLGEKDKAYENLKIYNKRKYIYQGMVTWIKTDPLFNSIRNEPEFQKIVRDQEARYNKEHERVRKWLEEHGIL